MTSDLQYDADFYEGKPFHKREFVLSALLLWVYCGGKIKFSRPSSNEYSSEVMPYLTLACELVMGRAPSSHTLAAEIQNFRQHNSRMWHPAPRPPDNFEWLQEWMSRHQI